MAKVSTSSRLMAPAETVWELIGDFNALADWHPAVEKSELDEGTHVRVAKSRQGVCYRGAARLFLARGYRRHPAQGDPKA